MVFACTQYVLRYVDKWCIHRRITCISHTPLNNYKPERSVFVLALAALPKKLYSCHLSSVILLRLSVCRYISILSIRVFTSLSSRYYFTLCLSLPLKSSLHASAISHNKEKWQGQCGAASQLWIDGRLVKVFLLLSSLEQCPAMFDFQQRRPSVPNSSEPLR